jgi:hypothetical protein
VRTRGACDRRLEFPCVACGVAPDVLGRSSHPDGIAYDPVERHVFVSDESGGIEAVFDRTGKRLREAPRVADHGASRENRRGTVSRGNGTNRYDGRSACPIRSMEADRGIRYGGSRATSPFLSNRCYVWVSAETPVTAELTAAILGHLTGLLGSAVRPDANRDLANLVEREAAPGEQIVVGRSSVMVVNPGGRSS